MRSLLQLLPVVIPTAIYLMYVYTLRRRAMAGGQPPPSWIDRTALYWSVIGGLVIALVLLFSFTFLTGAPPGSIYVPEAVVDGVVVPGHFLQPGEAGLGVEPEGSEPLTE